MRIFHRLRNLLSRERTAREIEEELRSHLEEAVERGRSAEEARVAFGSPLRVEEASRAFRLTPWLDSLAGDVVFGWRQLVKNRTVLAAAVLSLGLAIGSCTAAFRLIDALLLRPLPVQSPERLRVVGIRQERGNTGVFEIGDSCSHPLYLAWKQAAGDRADVLGIGYAERHDLTFSGDAEMEKATRQPVSGNALAVLGAKPVLGRILTPADDVTPGGHPYAVLTYRYWERRFGKDPRVIGRTFRMGGERIEIIGVLEPGFTGTETGWATDFFLPLTMNREAIGQANWHWFRTWVRLRENGQEEPVREILQATFAAVQRERVKEWPAHISEEIRNKEINQPLVLVDAASGASGMQKDYRLPLLVLAGVVALVLLIACVNVANLLTAQAAARAREMALRVSIGAGRARLLQLMLVESGMIAAAATLLGTLFSWWTAPLVVAMIGSRDNPVHLDLGFDWRVLGFLILLSLSVTLLFGLLPAWRASAIRPAMALKGGAHPGGRRRLMNALVAAQVAFCFLVHFAAGLFVSTLDRVTHQPLGFQADRLLAVQIASANKPRSGEYVQVAEQLATLPGVESAGLSDWALLNGGAWSENIAVNGEWLDANVYFLGVSPEWRRTLRIELKSGRDLRADDPPHGVAVVSEAFARDFFRGENPVGRSFVHSGPDGKHVTMPIVGLIADVRYRHLREPMLPVVLTTYRAEAPFATVMLRLAPNAPPDLTARIRREVPRLRPGFIASNIITQQEIIESRLVRERLLATFSIFFAGVALLLSGVGLFGVLNYAVVQQRREIGIRMALGARPAHVIYGVAGQTFAMLIVGSGIGLGLGIASERYIDSLLFGVRATDLAMLATPVALLLMTGVLAALAPAAQAVHVDPARTLRAE